MYIRLPSDTCGATSVDLEPRRWGTAPPWDLDHQALRSYVLCKLSRMEQLSLSSEQASPWCK
eukprot:638284-Alexandrium_andersonii.AAC.1